MQTSSGKAEAAANCRLGFISLQQEKAACKHWFLSYGAESCYRRLELFNLFIFYFFLKRDIKRRKWLEKVSEIKIINLNVILKKKTVRSRHLFIYKSYTGKRGPLLSPFYHLCKVYSYVASLYYKHKCCFNVAPPARDCSKRWLCNIATGALRYHHVALMSVIPEIRDVNFF